MSSNEVRPEFTADECNAYLVESGRSIDVNASTAPGLLIVHRALLRLVFQMSPARPDVARAISFIKSNSVGLDEIPLVFIKILLRFAFRSATIDAYCELCIYFLFCSSYLEAVESICYFSEGASGWLPQFVWFD